MQQKEGIGTKRKRAPMLHYSESLKRAVCQEYIRGEKTQQAILVAHYPEKVQPGNATTTVEKLADYLIGVGY